MRINCLTKNAFVAQSPLGTKEGNLRLLSDSEG